jgi:hypothetical protein
MTGGGVLGVATDGGEDGAVAAGFEETLGLAPFAFAFAFSTAQALRAFSVRTAVAHSARRADEGFRRLAFAWEVDSAAGTDTRVKDSDAAAARDGSALAASASTIALESTTARNSRQSRTTGRRYARSIERHPFRPRGTRREWLYGGFARTPIGRCVA